MAKFDNKPLLVLIFTIFIDVLGLGILIPVIPLLLADPHSPYFLLPNGFSLKQGYILLGYLTAIYPFMQFIAAPILGELSDVYGRKKVLAISLAGTAISYVLFAIGILTKNIPLLFISRGFDGITGGNFSVAQAALADVSTKENRAKTFGLMGATFGIGFILGPYIGGKLSDPDFISFFNAATPFWFAAILSTLNMVSVILFFPETLKTIKEKVKIHWDKSFKNIVHAFQIEELRTLFFTSFLFIGGFTFFTTFFGVYLLNKFGFTQGNTGDFFAYVGLWIAFTQAVVTRKVSNKLTESTVLKISLILTGLAVMLYQFPTVWWQLLFIVPLFAMFNGLSQANLGALVSKSASPERQGEILGINASLQALAQTIPPVLSGYLAASLSPNAPIYVSSAILILSGIYFIFFFKKHNRAVHSQENLAIIAH